MYKKQRKKYFLYASLSFALLWNLGCATTESRIKKHQDLFDQYDLETQTNIKNASVELGFDEQMVYLALGHPDRKYSRDSLNGRSEVWSYTSYETRKDRRLVPVRYHVRDGDGRSRSRSDHVWVNIDHRTEYEGLRIEMREGKVVAVERNLR